MKISPALGLLIFVVLGCSHQSSPFSSLSSDPPYVQYIAKQNFAPGFEPERQYVDKINKVLVDCILKNDPLEDYWDKVVLIPLETYIAFDNDWMLFLETKSIEFKNNILPDCSGILRENIKKLGQEPKEKEFHLLRAEFILYGFNNMNFQETQKTVFSEIDNRFQLFFRPIFEKLKSQSDKNQSDFNAYLNKKTIFWEYYNLLYKYALHEQSKLKIREELDNLYSPILDAKTQKWLRGITDTQQNILNSTYKIVRSATDQNLIAIKFFNSLTPGQYALFEREAYQRNFLEKERMVFKDRLLKFNSLAEWFKQNKQMADFSYYKQIREEELKAAQTQALGALLLGMSSAINAYNSWNYTYYRPYMVTNNNRTIQLYDQFGNYYYGKIK
jgi:hypothetical protein